MPEPSLSLRTQVPRALDSGPFMFFGRKRQKVIEHVTAQLRPVIGVLQISHGLPARFWQDHFVLGFFQFLIGFHSRYTSGVELGNEDRGRMVADVYTNLSNMNGLAIGGLATQLTMATEKSAEFERGGDNASVIAFYTYRKLRDADANLDVKWAREMAARMGKPNDHSAICGFLLMRLFLEPVKARFNPE